MSGQLDAATVAGDAEWLAHRYDPTSDAVHFLHAPRKAHRAATFLTDEHLKAAAPVIVPRSASLADAGKAAPLHFIFHSAFCCSTLLARALDLPGHAMGLKEPVILNDLVGWRHRGADPKLLARGLDGALTLLARPFGPDEAVVVKPSNIVNNLAPAMLAMRPDARALLLHAPLRTFLGSVARKGMEGRLWVRDLIVKYGRDGAIGFGFTGEDLLGHTDLQAAAVGWLVQQRLFAELAGRHPQRVRTIDSETLLGDLPASMSALTRLFQLTLSDADIANLVTSPAFTRHSKLGEAFDREARAKEQRSDALFADEVEKVAVWAEAVAASCAVPLRLPAPLLG